MDIWGARAPHVLYATVNLKLLNIYYVIALWCSIANHFSLLDYNLMTSKGNPREWVRFLSSQGNKQLKRGEKLMEHLEGEKLMIF
jgi:hypothetical protein